MSIVSKILQIFKTFNLLLKAKKMFSLLNERFGLEKKETRFLKSKRTSVLILFCSKPFSKLIFLKTPVLYKCS